jgi:dihydroxy-acid dehydratase
MTVKTKHGLRSREWFDIPGDPSSSAIHLERYTNYGISAAELRSGKPIIGIAQTGSASSLQPYPHEPGSPRS